MIVRVINAYNDNCWYNDCIGNDFHAFQLPDGTIRFSYWLFFYPQDVKIISNSKNAFIPVMVHSGLC